MTAILWAESKRRLRGSVILLGVLSVLAAMYVALFPGMADEMENLAETFPPWMFEIFGLDALHTLEGFLAAEIYSFFWALLVAIYFAHIGAGLIATDIRTRRMDLTLSNPVSRESVLLQKIASLWVPLLVLNVGLIAVLYIGSALIGEVLNPVALTMVHLLSVPYLVVCAGIGIVFSVVVSHDRTAKALAIGLVFLLWLVDAVSRLSPDYEWVGGLTPSRYWDGSAILVREEYALGDAGILSIAFLALVGIALVFFVRRDI